MSVYLSMRGGGGNTAKGGHMVAILVRPSLELWFSGVPLTSIIHLLECLIATQSVWLQAGPYFSFFRLNKGCLNIAVRNA